MNILGLGTAVPPHFIGQGVAAELASARCCNSANQVRWLRRAYETAGVEKRHSDLMGEVEGVPRYVDFFPPRLGPDDRGPGTAQRMAFFAAHAGPLALSAARSALAEASLASREVTHLITASCTGFTAPGLDYTLMGQLGLSPRVSRLHIGFMGCHAVLNAIEQAKFITLGDASARVLICAVELCTLHFQYAWDPDAVLANALFSDGAAALVIGGDPAVGRLKSGAATGGSRLRITATGSTLVPNSVDAMSWKIGDYGFSMTLSREVPELIETQLRPFVSEWLGESDLKIGQVGSWAVHPGGPRILAAVENALGLAPGMAQASREVLREFGNMSSPTIVFVLERLLRAAASRPIVALGFGPGLMVQAALFA